MAAPRQAKVSLEMLSGIVLAMVLTFWAGVVSSAGATAPTGGISLGVVPLTVHIEVDPGKSAEGEIEVSNPGTGTITVKAYAMDRTTKSTGQVFFSPPGSNRWSAAAWLSLSATSLSIGPGQAQRVTWKIVVPADAEPGEHTTVVFFEPERPAAQPGQVVLGARIGTVIAVEVPGEKRVQGRLLGFQAEQPPVRINLGPVRTSFKLPFGLFDSGPVPLAAAFENTGNVRIEATSKVEIKTRSGKTVATIDSGEPVTIYPDDSWNVSAVWDEPPTYGRFMAEVRVKYAEGQPELTASTTFIVFPILQTLALAVFAAGIWFIRGGISSLAQRRRRKREARQAAGTSSGGLTSGPPAPQAPPASPPQPQPTPQQPQQLPPEPRAPSPTPSTPAPPQPSVTAPSPAPPSPTPPTLPPRSLKTNAVVPTPPPAEPTDRRPSGGNSSSTVIGSRHDRKKK